MTLRVGDHLRIEREGVILGPDDEAYHEFEVLEVRFEGLDGDKAIYRPLIRVIR